MRGFCLKVIGNEINFKDVAFFPRTSEKITVRRKICGQVCVCLNNTNRRRSELINRLRRSRLRTRHRHREGRGIEGGENDGFSIDNIIEEAMKRATTAITGTRRNSGGSSSNDNFQRCNGFINYVRFTDRGKRSIFK